MTIIGTMKIAFGAGLIAASGLAAASPAEAQRYDRGGYGYDRGDQRDWHGRDDRRWDRRDDRRWSRGDRRDGWHRGQARWDRGHNGGRGWGRDNGYGRSRVVCRWERTYRGRVRNCFRVAR